MKASVSSLLHTVATFSGFAGDPGKSCIRGAARWFVSVGNLRSATGQSLVLGGVVDGGGSWVHPLVLCGGACGGEIFHDVGVRSPPRFPRHDFTSLHLLKSWNHSTHGAYLTHACISYFNNTTFCPGLNMVKNVLLWAGSPWNEAILSCVARAQRWMCTVSCAIATNTDRKERKHRKSRSGW